MELQLSRIHIISVTKVQEFLIYWMLASNILYVDNVQLPSLISQKNINSNQEVLLRLTEPMAEVVITKLYKQSN